MFGISITNESDKEVLTDTSNVFKLYAEGTVYSASSRWQSPADPYADPPGYRVVIPVPPGLLARQCMVFIQPKSNAIGLDPRAPNRGILDPFHYIASSANTPFKYKVFHPSNDGAFEINQQWGCEIYDGNGSKLFSTNHEILKVKEVSVDVAGNNDYSHSATPNAFYCLHIGTVLEKFYEFDIDAYDGYVYSQAFRQTSDTTLTWEWSLAFARSNQTLGTSSYQRTYVGRVGGNFGNGLGPLVLEDTF